MSEPLIISKDGVRNIYLSGATDAPALPRTCFLRQLSVNAQRVVIAITTLCVCGVLYVALQTYVDPDLHPAVYFIAVPLLPFPSYLVLFFLCERVRFDVDGITRGAYGRRRFIPVESLRELRPNLHWNSYQAYALFYDGGHLQFPHEGSYLTWELFEVVKKIRPDLVDDFLWRDLVPDCGRTFTVGINAGKLRSTRLMTFSENMILLRTAKGEEQFELTDLRRVERTLAGRRPTKLALTLKNRVVTVPLTSAESTILVYQRLKAMYADRLPPRTFW